MSRSSLRLAAVAAMLLPADGFAQGDQWFTVSSFDNKLRRIDPYTATTLSSVPITSASGTMVGGNGLATHPFTNELWGLLQLQGRGGNRALARIDPQTGIATVVGTTGDRFAGIAFDITGRLFGVTGDGANTPETLFTLDQMTAQPTLFVALGNGSDGETICYHLGTNQIFHASGTGTPNVQQILETVDLTTRAITNVPITGGRWGEVVSMTHLAGDNLLVCDVNFDLWIATTTGRIHMIGSLDHDAKGIANVKTSGGAYFSLYGFGCREPSGLIPVLGGSGTPSPNGNVTLRILNGPPSSLGVLALGFGTGQLPLTPSCVLQILPLSTLVVSIGGLNAKGVVDVPLAVPPIVPVDVYWQVAVISSSQLALSNPLRMRVQ